ncbi:hypothetical protein LCGC14_3122120 [marine sediment metagenome]|uniref:Uncharacterized protein n=1 Tax=marine sediment metagenome TaxID=412755 RepID=A0A0F8W1Y9_9ZZZZ
MAQNNERTIQVAVVIKKEDGYGSVARGYCTKQEIKNLSRKDFLDRIVAPSVSLALSEFKKKHL